MRFKREKVVIENFNKISCVAFKLRLPNKTHFVLLIVINGLFSFLTDLNECSRDKYYCHQVAGCTNYRGSFNCTCDQGYFGDGFECFNYVYASMIRYKIAALHVNDKYSIWGHQQTMPIIPIRYGIRSRRRQERKANGKELSISSMRRNRWGA